jgi:hypothetical protein
LGTACHIPLGPVPTQLTEFSSPGCTLSRARLFANFYTANFSLSIFGVPGVVLAEDLALNPDIGPVKQLAE